MTEGGQGLLTRVGHRNDFHAVGFTEIAHVVRPPAPRANDSDAYHSDSSFSCRSTVPTRTHRCSLRDNHQWNLPVRTPSRSRFVQDQTQGPVCDPLQSLCNRWLMGR